MNTAELGSRRRDHEQGKPAMQTSTIVLEHWTWGDYRSDATTKHGDISWHLLTDPQVDTLYLHGFGEGDATLSYGAMAVLYGTSKQNVQRHYTRAQAKLVKVGREAAYTADKTPAPAESRVPCAVCDTPWLTCHDCIARTFFTHSTGMLRQHGRHVQVPIEKVHARSMPLAVNLDEYDGHHRRSDPARVLDYHEAGVLSRNKLACDEDADDDD